MVIYKCDCCDIITNLKSNYNRHLLSKRHLAKEIQSSDDKPSMSTDIVLVTNNNEGEDEEDLKKDYFSCEYCDKKSLCDQYLDKCADIKSNKDIYVLESKYISESTVGKRKLLKFEDGEISTPANSSFINNLESDVFYRCYNLYLKNGQFLWGVNSGLYRV